MGRIVNILLIEDNEDDALFFLPGLSLNSFLDWIRTNPTVQQIPIVIYTGCLSVPAAITSVVRKSFFKSGDLDQTRLTVLEILGFAAREQI